MILRTNSFDVIVNRNVTWTLENPKDAYKEWMRVLKPGGSLIIFDACWYLWNYDKDLEKSIEKMKRGLRRNTAEGFISIQTQMM